MLIQLYERLARSTCSRWFEQGRASRRLVCSERIRSEERRTECTRWKPSCWNRTTTNCDAFGRLGQGNEPVRWSFGFGLRVCVNVWVNVNGKKEKMRLIFKGTYLTAENLLESSTKRKKGENERFSLSPSPSPPPRFLFLSLFFLLFRFLFSSFFFDEKH